METTLVVSQMRFFEGWISHILAACNYPTRNANFKSRFSDNWLKLVSFLVSISTRKDTTEEIWTKIKWKQPVYDTMSGKQKSFPLSLDCVHGTATQPASIQPATLNLTPKLTLGDLNYPTFYNRNYHFSTLILNLIWFNLKPHPFWCSIGTSISESIFYYYLPWKHHYCFVC